MFVENAIVLDSDSDDGDEGPVARRLAEIRAKMHAEFKRKRQEREAQGMRL